MSILAPGKKKNDVSWQIFKFTTFITENEMNRNPIVLDLLLTNINNLQTFEHMGI